MQRAGLCVESGVLEAQARALNAGYFLCKEQARPLFSVKIATSLDGKIATSSGESQWITGAAARNRGHLERAAHDGILTGIGTVLADDPELTCRVRGIHGGPVRIVLDTNLRISPRSRILTTAHKGPVWIVTACGEKTPEFQALASFVDKSVSILCVSRDKSGRCDAQSVARLLADRGMTRIMVEGGAAITTSFLRAGLCDRLLWFRAPKIIGADGLPGVKTLDVQRLTDSLGFVRREYTALDGDVLEVYEKY
jgi:diaminohydroxyphosphoribosylaminopyrimidine deaminase/5-amino-6-(5-phosphoribosylamino)uracil reductase